MLTNIGWVTMSQLEFGYKVTEMVWCMRFGENVDKLIFRRK